MIRIEPFDEIGWPLVWPILEPVFRAVESYAFSQSISETEAHRAWIEVPAASFVALDDTENILGTFYIKPNQPELGAHVCNCGYVVAESARGQGVATKMCESSQHEELKLGFLVLQYNLVVATNKGAVRLWQRLGFEIVGTLPQAFHHPLLGFVDAFVMYKLLK